MFLKDVFSSFLIILKQYREGLLTDDGFVIFKGSICQKTITQTAGPSLISLREKLINDNFEGFPNSCK